MRNSFKLMLILSLISTTSCGLYREAKTPEVAEAIAVSETSVLSDEVSEAGTGTAGSYGPSSVPLNDDNMSEENEAAAGNAFASSIQSSLYPQSPTDKQTSSDTSEGANSNGQAKPVVDICLELRQYDSAATDLVFNAKDKSPKLVDSLRELRLVFSRLSTITPASSPSATMLIMIDKGLSDLIGKADARSDPAYIVDQVKIGLERFSPEIARLLQSLNRLCPSIKSPFLTQPIVLY